ncbi:uncharacterized protein LOC103944837 isoform X2 [Pyrus x bretschneideri]|uniref:uncharacterized protein LOC103944837 isoform X2 n=1 Tax=Pyrus x bretschneideri TaxID=225117 RepID=UPI00202F8A12|nr:uncharacterized protein LOC103944837 isoform X2 [Pyrus x bretschneideri]
MALRLSPLEPHLFYHSRRSVRSENRQREIVNVHKPSRCSTNEQGIYGFSTKNHLLDLLVRCYNSSRWSSSWTSSSTACTAYSGQITCVNGALVARTRNHENEFNRVNCLEWVLHESARSFSVAVESLELPGSGPKLAMAWSGNDVHQWHKRISYQVAVYALLKTAIEVEILLSSERHSSDSSPVSDILTPKIDLIGEYIESQMNMRHSELVEWFIVVELPRMAGFFIPLLRKWSMEYAGSGVAGMVVAISCCAAVAKLGNGRVKCPYFSFSIEDVMVELMDHSHSLVSVERLHNLATEAGFEVDFLSHFGRKVLLSNKSEEVEFWIGLAHKKLSTAFSKESVIPGKQNFHDKVQADILATLGVFAYLGRRTRLFLSRMGIKDLDELVKDFLSYLECGSLFIHPEFSSVAVYQHFMEVVTDEIGWLDLYAACPPKRSQERQKSKLHAIQAEKEIALSAVFTVCYDVFSGFAHFSRSTQQSLDTHLLDFLLHSQSLLTVCLEDYWAAYDKSSELLKVTEPGARRASFVGSIVASKLSVTMEAQQEPSTLTTSEDCQNYEPERRLNLRKWKDSPSPGAESISSMEEGSAKRSKYHQRSLVKMYSNKLVSASSDIWMGTQLLFIDITISAELLLKQLRGHKVTRRERNKLKRTLNDITSLVPVTILMLLPVSAVGHAAMLAAINKYMPGLIPSSYSSERLDVVKQLKRSKKMEVIRRWNNLEDPSSTIT